MGYTISEKILMEKADKEDIDPGEIVTVEPDRVMSHDNTAAIVNKFKRIGLEEVQNPEKMVVVFDHCVPAEEEDYKLNHLQAREFVEDQDIENFLGTAGVSHQVMMEKGYVLPGQLVLGADSHSTLYGSMNAMGIPINRTGMAGVWAQGETWLKTPETIRFNIEGDLQENTSSKDIILNLLGDLGSDAGNYRSLEFHGETIDDMSMSSRMTMTNMAVEMGAKAGIMPFDETTKEYIDNIDDLDPDYDPVEPDSDASYEKEIELDVTSLEPQIACPPNVDNVEPISEVEGIEVNRAYLGSCTNGRMEDLERAARILDGNDVSQDVHLVVYPASNQIMGNAREMGILETLEKSGADIRTASCGPCFGAVGETAEDGDVYISSSNRNFPGRMGSKDSEAYLGSPSVVAASSIEGEITNPIDYI